MRDIMGSWKHVNDYPSDTKLRVGSDGITVFLVRHLPNDTAFYECHADGTPKTDFGMNRRAFPIVWTEKFPSEADILEYFLNQAEKKGQCSEQSS